MKNRFQEEALLSPACFSVLQLSAIKGLGLKSFHQLHQHFGSASAILSASMDDLLASGIRPKLATAIDSYRSQQSCTLSEQDERLLSWLSETDQHLICLEDTSYPASLREVFCPPPLLYVKGCLDIFSAVSLAVVGSRRPTPAGQRLARRFASQLAEQELVVTSGLAIGIDTFAHQGSLSVNGSGCAVLGSGLDCIYPRQNQDLGLALCERGALVSEMALGVQALPANFPRRNRIISGLSRGVLVVEAGLKSGSLITAEFALEQNRDVFAIPGPIDSAVSRGCHALIKQGAFLVEELEDILSVLASSYGYSASGKLSRPGPVSNRRDTALAQLEGEELAICKIIGHQTLSFDELMYKMQIEVASLTNLLMSLELKGILCSSVAGYHLS